MRVQQTLQRPSHLIFGQSRQKLSCQLGPQGLSPDQDQPRGGLLNIGPGTAKAPTRSGRAPRP